MIILYSIILSSLWAAFTILLIGKLGWRDFVITYGPQKISQLFDCDFCLSFWLNVFYSLLMFAIMLDPLILIVPFVGAPITRKLL